MDEPLGQNATVRPREYAEHLRPHPGSMDDLCALIVRLAPAPTTARGSLRVRRHQRQAHADMAGAQRGQRSSQSWPHRRVRGRGLDTIGRACARGDATTMRVGHVGAATPASCGRSCRHARVSHTSRSGVPQPTTIADTKKAARTTPAPK